MNKSKLNTEDKVINQFALSNFSLKNRITVVLLLIMLVVLGVGAYNNLPKESYPEVEQSSVYVGTPYPGNSPTDIENLITRPIEKELNSISEIKEIRSNSIQGYSTIVAEFQSGIDIEYAKSKVNDAVDKAKINLPSDLPTESSVYEVSFSDFPVMSVTLSGEYQIEELENYSNELEKPVGFEGRSVKRNAPSLFNVAYLTSLFHDARETTLEHQVWHPILASNEMAMPSQS